VEEPKNICVTIGLRCQMNILLERMSKTSTTPSNCVHFHEDISARDMERWVGVGKETSSVEISWGVLLEFTWKNWGKTRSCV